MDKKTRHAMIRDRAAEAIRRMYHNATVYYPSVSDDFTERFDSWFEDMASSEIDYIQHGGAHAETESAYLSILSADCNAGRYKSEAARRYYVRKGMRDMRHDRSKYATWERINEFGTIYTYGRGGRTLAPEKLVKHGGGGSFGMNCGYVDDISIADCVELIRIVESFNAYVAVWCRSVPIMWYEYFEEELNGGDVDSTVVLSTTD